MLTLSDRQIPAAGSLLITTGVGFDMPRNKDMAPGVARRLRALMVDMKLGSVHELAEFVDKSISRSQASNWINGYNLPPAAVMSTLCEKTGLTLDWIYRGIPDGLTHVKAIRLQAVLEGIGRLPDLPSEPPVKAGRGLPRVASKPKASPKSKVAIRRRTTA